MDKVTPVNVSGLSSGVSAISTMAFHTCALLNDGSVKCWGNNQYGELGVGYIRDISIPLEVAELTSEVFAISLGYYHTCALLNTGGVQCWGWNYHGQLGDGTNTDSWAPVDVRQ